MNNSKISLKKLLSKSENNRLNIIEIPMLQRDYAQGRTDDKTSELRRKFIQDLFDVLITEKQSLHLDFIYGPVKDGVFRPIDGQQRLTTLFLLYWFVAVKAEETNEVFEYLKNFRYKVRATSQEFIDSILNPDNLKGLKLTKKDLKDAKWYYSAWNYDPTVQGMLEMIDTINCLSKSSKLPPWESVYNNLDNITFSLLPMDKFGLGDELFMRMNARGLALTDFENFKAWLQDYTRKYEDDFYFNASDNSWIRRIDGIWTDKIWSISDKDSVEKENSFDQCFLRLFKRLGTAYAVAENKELLDLLVEKMVKDKYIPHLLYDTNKCFSLSNLKEIFKLIDFLINKENEFFTIGFQKKDLFSLKKLIFREGEGEIRKITVIAYAVSRYLGKDDKHDKYETQFQDWCRVIRNLVENTIINNNQLFINAVKSVDLLLKKSGGKIISFLAGQDETFTLSTFNSQLPEEILKAKLINADRDSWSSEIENAENHPLFRGQVEFLLKKMDENENLINLISADHEVFAKHARIAAKLWNEKGSAVDNNDNFLLFRAVILTNFKYEFCWQKKLYPSNWKENFREESFRKSIITLLDQLNLENSQEILDSIEIYLNEKITNLSLDPSDWKYHIVKYGDKLLAFSSTKKIQQYYEHGVYVFEKSNKSGGDIWINKNVQARNSLIQALIDPTSSNKYQLLHDWADPDIDSSDFKYFKGHDVSLKIEGIEDRILKINEKELIIEDSKTSALIVKQEYANSSFEDITNWLTVNLCSDS